MQTQTLIDFLMAHPGQSALLLVLAVFFILNEYLHPELRLNLLLPHGLVDLLNKGLKKKKLVLLDLRPEAAYLAGHIMNALSLPAAELKVLDQSISALGKLGKLLPKPPALLVLISDRGLATGFKNKFSKLGYELAYLDGGIRAWQQAGLPLVKQ
ncbi:MAG: rhodanese-like domain-containing protein [Gammaproteobacteria bacterium]